MRWAKKLVALICICLGIGVWLSYGLLQALQDSAINWAQPNAKIVQRIGVPSDLPEQPNYQSNLDCSTLTFRTSSDSTMRAGCFVSSAFGLVDPDSQLIIPNGTDEAVELKSYSNGEVITPWQASGAALALDTINTGGSQLSMYDAVYESLQTNRSVIGTITSKQFKHPPDHTIRLSDGRVLIINPQTMAFSANGSWLVAESYQGAFVRVNLATLLVTPFAQSFAALGSPSLYKSGVTITNDGRFVAIENTASNSFRVYDLAGCAVSITTIATNPCPNYDYKPFLGTALGVLKDIRHVRFVNDSLLIFDASQDSGASRYALAPSTALPALASYLGLGDSYTSGEGAFDYRYGTDSDTNHCHLSSHSYPLVIGDLLYGSNDSHSVACSGAVISDIMPNDPTKYRGQISGGTPAGEHADGFVEQTLADFMPGVLAQNEFTRYLQPKIVSVSIGGNDIGFGDIITACVAPHISITPSANTCFSTQEDRQEITRTIDRTIQKWAALYAGIHKVSPRSRIFVIGYPSVVAERGSCGLNVHLNEDEIHFANQLVTYLNSRIAQAAQQAQLQYVDIEQALNGHRLCEAKGSLIAVNGLTAGKDSGVGKYTFLGRESYHPNMLGHQLLAAAILKKTGNFSSATGDTTSTAPDIISVIPKSGRVVRTTQSVPLFSSSVVHRGVMQNIHIEGQQYGIEPNSPFEIRSGDSNGLLLGTGNSQANGDIIQSISIPNTIPSGGAYVHIIINPSQGLSSQDLNTYIYIPATSTDADNDGLDDERDSCPYGTNSLIDEDKDGIDDSCDGSIVVQANAQIPPSLNDTATTIPPSAPATSSGLPEAQSQINSPPACTSCGKVLGVQSSSHRDTLRGHLVILPLFAWTLIPFLGWLVLVLLGSGLGKIWQYTRQRLW